MEIEHLDLAVGGRENVSGPAPSICLLEPLEYCWIYEKRGEGAREEDSVEVTREMRNRTSSPHFPLPLQMWRS